MLYGWHSNAMPQIIYMSKEMIFPDYILESSWEVCNKVGGIYAVLSTRAKTLQERLKDHLIFIGPDCWGDQPCPYFAQDDQLLAPWVAQAAQEGIRVRVGRWTIPGEPIAVLVDFKPFFEQKDAIYGQLWNDFSVDSLHAYGDYDEASMFSYAAAKVVESFYHFYLDASQKVVYHGNEWMTSLGLLYIRKHLPQVATIFTTHATSIGRSIAGNNKPLYDYMKGYNGDQMASELNMESKHSVEKQCALNVDCFTTVSDITNVECAQLLEKKADVVVPNGFEDDFVPRGAQFTAKRKAARKRLLQVANALMGTNLNDDTLLLSTSGRYEWRNKGIDVFIEAMNRLRHDNRLEKNIVAFIEVPGWVAGPRLDLQERLASGKTFDTPLGNPTNTHWLHNEQDDKVQGMLRWLDIQNRPEDKVKIIQVPCYLTGDDGIINLSYFDTIIGNDLSVYPSYYEPWGYTPLESVAFKVPTITTTLAGFGLWANQVLGHEGQIEDGAKVIRRGDANYDEVADEIRETVLHYTKLTPAEQKKAHEAASKLSKKALWSKFITYYEQAYDKALRKRQVSEVVNKELKWR